MIIVDLNQTMIGTFHVQVGKHTNVEIDEHLFKHMVYNTLRSYNMKYKDLYGEMVIACDSRNTWRRDMFPLYKAQRKKDRAKTDTDWNAVYQVLNSIQAELKENFPYKVISIPHTEADDIIATLTRLKQDEEKILIMSADKDFIQLQNHPNVRQMDPIRKRYITTENAEKYLFEHIVRGDRGDGIPNILSPDNALADGIRMKPVRQTMIDNWYRNPPEEVMTAEQYAGWKRNEALINLSLIPQDIQDDIVEQYTSSIPPTGDRLLDYLMKQQMPRLIESIGDFL